MNPYLKNVSRIEFSVTHRCQGRCRHCALGTDRTAGELTPEMAVAALEDAYEACSLLSVRTFGGEPLLCVPTVCALHQRAEALDVHSRELITSGCFTHDRALRAYTADRLEASGVNVILLSVDAFHSEHLPLRGQYGFARDLCAAGLGSATTLHPAWIDGLRGRNPYDRETVALLSRFEPLRLPVGEGNRVFPGGSAAVHLFGYFEQKPLDMDFQCGTTAYTQRLDAPTALAVDPDGSVRVCGFAIGNLHRQTMAAILKGYDPYRYAPMRALLEQGISGLITFAAQQGITVRPEACASPCALCRSVSRQLQ
ncbi:radical SAM protein [Eubacterium sp. 1001713B170207_170306_E7]|uniref:radical SAM protein n=1 Tax=Eubacterium sp. 1001713B170207_170306_E7 TaxID=2787097 RepID=UPI00189AC302|nr:radical SAM protein [Eubacterium sp. 1001713B170207_170306_E7]